MAKSPEQELLIATNNQGKINEITKYLNIPDLNIYSYLELSNKIQQKFIPDPEEDGENYFDNALIKAKAAYPWGRGVPVLADDSGIEAEFLDWAPGINSARFAGENATAEDNLNKLLDKLKTADNLNARYVCHLVFYDGNTIKDFRGELLGKIVRERAGDGGFGYDPIFIPDGFLDTLANLKAKGEVVATHRMRAMELFKSYYLNSY